MLCFFGPSHDRHDFIHQKPEASCTAHTGSRAKKFYRDGSRAFGGKCWKTTKVLVGCRMNGKEKGEHIKTTHRIPMKPNIFWDLFGSLGWWSNFRWYCWWFVRNPVNSPVEGKVVEIPLFTGGFVHLKWLFGISEPSTVSKQHIYKTEKQTTKFQT